MSSKVKVTVSESRNPEPTKDGPPAHHVGHPTRTHFKNPWPSAGTSNGLIKILQARFGSSRNFVPIPENRAGLVNIRKPDWGHGTPDQESKLKATWIGHASWYVETASAKETGLGILFDPVWSERTSPFQFIGPKRYTPVPCTISELPRVDMVVISHNHYDHLDYDSIKQLWKRSSDIHFFCPLGIKAWFVDLGIGIGDDHVTELDWWDSVRVEVPVSGSIQLTCTPSQHFSSRSVRDRDQTLWSSWVVEEVDGGATAHKLYFAGDTGYRTVDSPSPTREEEASKPVCPAFKQIGEVFGGFDLAMLPIGLYSPRDHMSNIHCAPEDSVLIHKDIKSKRSIGMHYGTVRGGLSQYYEEVTEPPRRFKEACLEAGLRWNEEVFLIEIGETFSV